MIVLENLDLLLLEQIPEDQFDDETGDDEIEGGQIIEFENIKRLLIYNKLKDLKVTLKRLAYLNNNPKKQDILDMADFIALVLLYYNTLTYEQIIRLFNNLLESLKELLNIPEGEAHEQ